MSILNGSQINKLKRYNGYSPDVKHTKDSDSALRNQLRVFGRFELVSFGKEINWNYKHKHSIATFQIYLHCMHFIRTLTNSYLATEDKKYITKAKELILQWVNSTQNASFKSKNSAWKDHSVASRMKNFIHFQFSVPIQYRIDNQLFEEIVVKHCNFLSLREYYSENNHGMMSDEALLFLSNFIKDEEKANFYQEVSVLRMERIIYKLFSSMSYNLENSPEYHRLTQNLSSRFIRLVDIMGIQFDQRCRDIINKSFENNQKILKPDLSYPMIGDTGYFVSKLEKNFNNFIDYQAGLVIINSENISDQRKSNWLSFKSGYLSRSHKHRDDLSITYFHQGEDILIDTGKYTYDRHNPFKSYVMSPQAHSTVYNINNSYELIDIINDVDRMKVTFVYENESYIHIAGINHLYEDIRIYRDIIYFENKGMFIVDRIFSNEVKFIAQNFNLAPNLSVNELNKNNFEIVTPENRKLYLREHTDRTLNKYFNHKNKTRGFYSEKFNELKETHQIEFRKNSVESFFITSLFDDSIIISDVEEGRSSIKFKFNNVIFHINLQSINK